MFIAHALSAGTMVVDYFTDPFGLILSDNLVKQLTCLRCWCCHPVPLNCKHSCRQASEALVDSGQAAE